MSLAHNTSHAQTPVRAGSHMRNHPASTCERSIGKLPRHNEKDDYHAYYDGSKLEPKRKLRLMHPCGLRVCLRPMRQGLHHVVTGHPLCVPKTKRLFGGSCSRLSRHGASLPAMLLGSSDSVAVSQIRQLPTRKDTRSTNIHRDRSSNPLAFSQKRPSQVGK